MKTKLLKSTVSLLLVLLLCLSIVTPAFFADDNGEQQETAEAITLDKHANSAKVSRNDLMSLFGDSSSSSVYYGIASPDAPETITNVTSSSSASVTAGVYIAYRTTAYTGNILNRKADWTNLDKRTSQDFSVRLYYNADFTVRGCKNGALYLNGDQVSGRVRLYTDESCTVTAAQVEGFILDVTGVTPDEEFTPEADLTVTATYTPEEYATVTISPYEGGSVKIMSDGMEITDIIPAGDSFEVVATPNANRGYELESVVVTKDGEAVEAVEGLYGPVADDEVYAVTVIFNFNPEKVDIEVDAASGKISRSELAEILGSYSNYGIAPASDPDNITQVRNNYSVEDGEYYIYGSNESSWTNAKLMILDITTYYSATFTVAGNDDGEIYLNGELAQNCRLYPDKEYTVTAKEIEGYTYVMEGAEDGVAFSPSGTVNVTVTYLNNAFATFSLNVGEGGTAEVQVDGVKANGRVDDGESFTVEATPNTDRGYELDSIVVTKDEEVVEAVEGVYGPVADGESYEITVTFNYNPAKVYLDIDASSGRVSRSDLADFLGSYSYYGIAPASDPDDITQVRNNYSVEAGEYYIYGSKESSWGNAKLMILVVRTYYKGSFTVTGNEEGELYLNGEAVEGTVKLYTDETYTVTAKEIEEYIYTVYGVEEGVEFTPSQAIDVTAVYIRDAYATIDLTAGEGGTVAITSDGETVYDKLEEGKSFEITAKADSKNNYILESLTVTKDGVEVEPVDGVYGPVAKGEVYEINVVFTKVELIIENCEVNYIDIKKGNFTAVLQSIIDQINLTPESLKDMAEFDVKYAAYNLLGVEIYEPINYSGLLAHDFGTSSLSGELAIDNTETIRITCEIPGLGIKLQVNTTATVKDLRKPTRVEGGELTITYGDDLRAAAAEVITVYNENDEVVEFTAEDLKVDPETPNATFLSRAEVTVTYGGSDDYASSSGTVSVYVRRARSSLDAESEMITYGETPEAKVVTDPENLDFIRVIAGIDDETQGYVSIDIPESVKKKMRITVAGVVLFDIYEYMCERIGDGTTISELRDIISSIFERVNGNELIRNALIAAGYDMDTLEAIMNFVDSLPEINTNLKIRLGQAPKNAGVYMLFAVSTDLNYRLATDIAFIVIRPKGSSDEEAVSLRFKTETEDTNVVIPYDEAQSFVFGGDVYVNDKPAETSQMHTLYAGITLDGDVVIEKEPITEPGYYVETVYLYGGNYMALPIVRRYTVSLLHMDDMSVEYDGAAHYITAAAMEGVDLAEVTYHYSDSDGNSCDAPVDAGVYTVSAEYKGVDYALSSSATATLTILPQKLIVTIDDQAKETGDDDPDFTFTVTFADGEPADAEALGIVIAREEGDTAGAYKIYVSEIADSNYAVDEAQSKEGVLTVTDPVYYMRGDVDGDDEVSIADTTLIVRTIVELPVPDGLDITAADVDGDEDVSIADATFIQRYLAELGNPYNVGELIKI